MAFQGYNNSNRFLDYQKAEEEFQLKKQLANAQLAASQAELQKASQIDADKLGEQAFLKASQGLPLTPQEGAALKYIDAKSPTAAFNPVTGVMEQKPSLLQRAGIGGAFQPSAPPPAAPSPRPPAMNPDDAATIGNLFAPDQTAPLTAPAPSRPLTAKEQFDQTFSEQLANAEGNPKLQQQIKADYAKAQIQMSDSESKAAGFADRMRNSDPVIDDKQAAGMSQSERMKAAIPLLGNFIVSGDYQSFNQAQRDFINAQLRRESGAVISPSEFDNAEKQYFPMPGDNEQVLAQKKANREAALLGMERSAGPAYRPTVITEPKKSASQPNTKPYAPIDGKSPIVSTQEQFDALPSGATYMEAGADGKLVPMRKP